MLTDIPSSGYAVEVMDVSKAYGSTVALTHLTLRIPPGFVFGLVGARGAGKSTCLRALAGLVRVDAGEAWVAGLNVRENLASARDRVGYMPEIFGKYGHLTVYEYLDFYGSSFGIRPHAKEQLFRDLLDLVDLLGKRDDLVDSLTSGAKRRLSLARCLLHDPEVLLLDEPIRDMTSWEAEELCSIVQELSHLGKTVLLATEKVGEAEAVCDEIGLLKQGQITERREIKPQLESVPITRLELRLLNPRDIDVAATILRDSPGSSGVRIEGERNLSAAFSGKEEDAPALLETMRAAGVWVTGFSLSSVVPEAPSPGGEATEDLRGAGGKGHVAPRDGLYRT